MIRISNTSPIPMPKKSITHSSYLATFYLKHKVIEPLRPMAIDLQVKDKV
jgi:hypothetical protein